MDQLMSVTTDNGKNLIKAIALLDVTYQKQQEIEQQQQERQQETFQLNEVLSQFETPNQDGIPEDGETNQDDIEADIESDDESVVVPSEYHI